MTYNEKKSLYESIMKEVAKTVKRRINEGFNGDLTYTLYFEEYDSKTTGTLKISGNDYDDLMLNVDAIIEASLAVMDKVYVKFNLHNDSEKRNLDDYKVWRKTVDDRTEHQMLEWLHPWHAACAHPAAKHGGSDHLQPSHPGLRQAAEPLLRPLLCRR